MFPVEPESTLTWCEYDRQFNEFDSPVPNSFLDEDLSLAEDAGPPLPIPGPSLVLDSDKRALQRLISRAAPDDEFVSLINAVFSSRKASNIVGCLGENDAQPFIDTMDEVCHHASRLRRAGC